MKEETARTILEEEINNNESIDKARSAARRRILRNKSVLMNLINEQLNHVGNQLAGEMAVRNVKAAKEKERAAKAKKGSSK